MSVRPDHTQKLEKYANKYVRVNYNVAQNVEKISVMFGGTLLIYRTHYSISATGGTWIAFTDDNISNVWDESVPYIELKV